jgi:hypothetical protein
LSETEQNAEMAKILDKALFATDESDGINAVRTLAEYKQKALSKLFEITINDFVKIRVKKTAASEIEKIGGNFFSSYNKQQKVYAYINLQL